MWSWRAPKTGYVTVLYESGVLLVAVLKGSVIFLADLVRRLTINPVVDFLAALAGDEAFLRIVG